MVKGWATFAHRFEQHYQNFTPWLPPRLRTREWMFIPFGGGTPRRHIRLNDAHDIKRKLVSSKRRLSYFLKKVFEDGFLGRKVLMPQK